MRRSRDIDRQAYEILGVTNRRQEIENGVETDSLYAEATPPRDRISANAQCKTYYGDNANFQEGDTLQSMSEQGVEVELTPLEYARLYGLSIDYRSEPLLDLQSSFPKLTDSASDVENPEDETDLHLLLNNATGERLEGPAQALSILQAAIVPPENQCLSSLPGLKPASVVLKLELPLLRTDNELDVLHFGHKPTPDFRSVQLPLENLNTENDEGMNWPSKYLNVPKQLEDEYGTERLEVPKDAAHFLVNAIADPGHLEDAGAFYTTEPPYVKSNVLEPVTPPLLPLTPPLTPFAPSPSAAELELLSESTGPIAAEIDIINAQLSKQDAIVPLDVGVCDDLMLDRKDGFLQMYSPLHSVINSDTPSSPHKRKASDLKIEVPLTPPNLPSSPRQAKHVSFPEMLHEIVPSPALINENTIPAEHDSEASLEAFFNDIIEPIALEANRVLEQEQLQEADSLLRVDVPVMDFNLPAPPWKTYARRPNGKYPEGMTELDAQKKLLRDVISNDLKHFHPWTGVSKIERLLPWSPFPLELGKVALDETIDDPRYLAAIMDDMTLEDVAVSDSLTWKPDGLRIFDELQESEDELEPAPIEEENPTDMDGLIRKRRRELASEEVVQKKRPAAGPERKGIFGVEILANQEPRTMKASATDLKENSNNYSLVFGDTFSASAALSNFMRSMGQMSQKPVIHAGERIRPPILASSRPNEAVAQGVPLPLPAGEGSLSPSSVLAPLPSPSIPKNPPIRYFILSFILLQSQRSLVRLIGRSYSAAIYIERDFSSIPTAPEADILLSASTGLVLTTLQKIKQRALPGQATKISGLRERLASLSVRYERIVLFISEGSAISNATKILDHRDCEALAEFMGFASSLEADIQVNFVPGGEEELVKWVIGCMLQYGMQDAQGKEVRLLQDETMWEQFLRRAGLNAFAAQLILAEMKPPDLGVAMQTLSSSNQGRHAPTSCMEFGLRAFVRMPPKKRVQKFELLLGGSRVLNRVNKVLEQQWLSATTGFYAPI